MNHSDAIKQFRDTMRARGIVPPDMIEADSKLHRFSSNGKRGDDAGWYVFHANGIPAGCFGDWRTDINETWRADIGRKLTPAEEADHRANIEAMRRERETEKTLKHAEARYKAAAIWKSAAPARDDHPYLPRKGVPSVSTLRELHADQPLRFWIMRRNLKTNCCRDVC
jgi:putative DNA primase/helicase